MRLAHFNYVVNFLWKRMKVIYESEMFIINFQQTFPLTDFDVSLWRDSRTPPQGENEDKFSYSKHENMNREM